MQKVIEALRFHDAFLVACHVEPDPDCVGSMLALGWALERTGKRVTCVSPDPLVPAWRFLPRTESVVRPDAVTPDWEALVVVDCELERTGPVAEWKDRARQVINIDHHVTNPGTGDVNLIDADAAAAAEIIYRLIRKMGLELEAEAATLLYAALMADTGSFRFSNTNAQALGIAADLVDHGASPAEISRQMYDTRSWAYVKLLGRVLETLERGPDGFVAWITVTQAMIAAEGARSNETEGFIQYPRMIDGVEVAVLFREVGPGETRVSFRSKGSVDVSAIARRLGGGGHPQAAGCTLKLPLDEARPLVLARLPSNRA